MVAVRKDFQLAGEGVNVRGGESSSRRESALTFGMSELTFAATVRKPPLQRSARPAFRKT
jgi:hypothetical protein